jgi:hypothetical protein
MDQDLVALLKRRTEAIVDNATEHARIASEIGVSLGGPAFLGKFRRPLPQW